MLSNLLNKYDHKVFDIETTMAPEAGAKPYVFSASFRDSQGSKNYYRIHEGPKSYIGQKFYDLTNPASKQGVRSVADSKLFAADIVKEISNSKIIVGHNLDYDLKHSLALAKEHNLDGDMISSFGKWYDSKSGKFVDRLENGAPKDTNLKALYRGQGDAKSAYRSYISNAINEVRSGRIGVIDTLDLTRMLMVRAQQRKDLNFKFKDFYSGTKLEYIKAIMPGASQGTSHVGEVDTGFTKDYLDYFANNLEEVFGSGPISEQTNQFLGDLQALNHLQVDVSRKTRLATVAGDFAQYGEHVTEIGGEERRFKNIGDYLNDFSFLYPDQNAAQAEYEGYFKQFSGFTGDKETQIGKAIDALGRNAEDALKNFTSKRMISPPDAPKVGFHVPTTTGKQSRNKYLIGAGVVLGGLGIWSLMSNRIDSSREAANTIPGMQKGGMAEEMRHQSTDFGSPWAMNFAKSIAHELSHGVKTYPLIFGGGLAAGLYMGREEGKKSGSVDFSKFATNMAIDMIDDVLIFGAPMLTKTPVGKYLKKVEPILEHKYSKMGGVGFFGWTLGHMIGEGLGAISAKDDAYNTIPGMRHGGMAQSMRRAMTDFGSGVRSFFNGFKSIETGMLMMRKKLNIQNSSSMLKGVFDESTSIAPKVMIRDRLSGYYNFSLKGDFLLNVSKEQLNKIADVVGATAPSTRRGLMQTTIAHELFEAHHSKLTGNLGTTFGSHVSSGVIADEAIFAKILGQDVFDAQRNVRKMEANTIRKAAGYNTDKAKRLLETKYAEELNSPNRWSPSLWSDLEKKRFNAAENLLDFVAAQQEATTHLPYVKRVETIYQNVDDKWGQIANKFNWPTEGRVKSNLLGNKIDGMQEGGWASKLRKIFTAFGSPWRGGAAGVHHPELEEDYNTAKDMPRYQMMRASKVGVPSYEMFQYMTEPDKGVSPYVGASAAAGTALHKLMQAEAFANGTAYDAEMLIANKEAGIAGHADILTEMGIGDIKTVSSGIFSAIQKEGRAKQMHKTQVNFYLGSAGVSQGYIQYVNRDKPNQQKFFFQQFNPTLYEDTLRKVDRERRRVGAMVEANNALEAHLPRAASLERLYEADRNRESVEEQINSIPQYKKAFREEMQYLRATKRGMPTTGSGRARIRERDRRQNTQGIGLQIFNNRNQHHIM